MDRFSQNVFKWAGVYGIVVLLPQYFTLEKVGIDFPPPITHPEFYYGFTGVALAWQVAFLIIARDPIKYRLMMIPGIFEKLAFSVPTFILFAQGQAPATLLVFATIDLFLALMFWVSFKRLKSIS